MIIVYALGALAVLALLGRLHRYLWVRLVRDTTATGGVGRRVGTGVLVALPLLSVAALVSRGGVPFRVEQVVAWPGFLWLAVLLYLTPLMLAGEAVRAWALRGPGRRSGPDGDAAPGSAAPGPDPGTGARSGEQEGRGRDGSAGLRTRFGPEGADAAPAPGPAGDGSALSRRRFVARTVGGSAAALALGTVGHGTYGVLRGPRVKRVTVPLARLPRSAHGFRIAVVSDIHLGPILGRPFAQRVVDTVNATQPDLIAVVGDLVDGSVARLGHAAEPLAQLSARHGSFFVTGNHEYYSGADAWVAEVRELGLHPLENERVESAGFDLAGVNDVQGESRGEGPDFGKALGGRDRTRAVVLLAHQPVVIHDAVRYGVDLQLSGHTHGGQLFPGNYIAELANPTVAGLDRYGDTQLYVSRGAGAWGPPVRVGAPSDITVVELASKQA